jgi:hypothetical protein
MSNDQAQYGFITYFVDARPQRIPVEFYAQGKKAWLDGSKVAQRLSTNVTPEMEPHILGTFQDAMESYREESIAILSWTSTWEVCINGGAGLLLLFRMMHEMRQQSCDPSKALDVAVTAMAAIRDSEMQQVRFIEDMLLSSQFSTAASSVGNFAAR